jgi:uncharacterized protein YkwD
MCRWAVIVFAACIACEERVAPSGPALPVEEPFATEANLARAMERDIVRWTNLERMQRRLPPTFWSEVLARAARAHNAEMLRLGYFEHDSPNPRHRTVLLRVQQAGLRARSFRVGENLAKGNWRSDRARKIVRDWMESDKHRDNLLLPSFRFMGVSVLREGSDFLVTQVLGTSG